MAAGGKYGIAVLKKHGPHAYPAYFSVGVLPPGAEQIQVGIPLISLLPTHFSYLLRFVISILVPLSVGLVSVWWV